MKRFALAFSLLLASTIALAQVTVVDTLPPLQQPVSNNAVAAVSTAKGVFLYSFLGLGSGKTWRDISTRAAVLEPGAQAWKELATVPGKDGRLAASAVTAGGAVWLFGGYTVSADGSEASTPGVYRIRPGEPRLQWVTDMPVGVEDSLAVVYRDRYIYLVSGWHDLGNVNLVQVLDTQTLIWAQATPWPGAPVFGHAGGISADRLLVCDGVKIRYPANAGPRQFLPSDACWQGSIDARNYRHIAWREVASHPGAARYRMAATGDDRQRVVFAGGSGNPYNFNGIGYNGMPAPAERSVFSYSFATGLWQIEGHLPLASMDHRGLPFAAGWYYLVGGMHNGQTSVADVLRFRLDGVATPLQRVDKPAGADVKKHTPEG